MRRIGHTNQTVGQSLSISQFLIFFLLCFLSLRGTMWSSSGRNNDDNNNGNDNNNNRVSVSPSKSSSTCSSPSPFSPSSPNTNTSTRKSMEEVWKDINLASLHDHSDNTTTNTSTNRTSFPGLILQDFFSRPLNKDPPSPLPTTTATKQSKAAAALSNNEPSSPLGDITASFGSLVPPKATMLSLNSSSGCDFQFLENSGPIRPNQTQHFHPNVGGLGSCSFASSQNSPFDALGSPTPFHSFCKKRPQENDDNSDDRRHKRMIKNRESAARSRARKQAYTNELELEVAHLLEENAKLRRQLDKFLAASEKLPKKNSLYRTSTAPF